MTMIEFNVPLCKISNQLSKKPISVRVNGVLKTVYKSNDTYFLANERCRHRNMNLVHAKICSTDDMLVCPYHGKKNKAESELFEKYNFLWLSDPSAFFTDIPNDYLFCGSQSEVLSAPFHVVVDNFNEGSHTPHVHRFLGPEIKDIPKVKFSWTAAADHVDINYFGPQKKNILFYGLNFNKNISWKINWKTYVQPMHMRYQSEWSDDQTNEKLIEENITYFFLDPVSDSETKITTFVFVKPLSYLKFFPGLVKKVSLFMTMNQIREDQIFYPKIQDLPKDIEHLQLDEYDQPLLEIRKRAMQFYKKYF